MIQFENTRVCIFQSALFKTTSTVLNTPDFVLIVDPNWLPEEVRQIQEYVQKNRKGKQLLLLFTHSDYDHILGYGAFPDAKVIASESFVENKDRHKILEQINQFDDEYYIERDYPVCYPKIDIIIRSDGQTLKFDRSALTFFLAPGHNPDGIFTLVQPGNVWIAGDYLSDVEFPYIYYSSKLYENTLKKGVDIMEKFSPSLLVPGHGNATADIDEMKKRIEESESYIRLLKKCVQNEVPFPFDQLMLKYRFPGIMKRFHEENVALIRKELRKT